MQIQQFITITITTTTTNNNINNINNGREARKVIVENGGYHPLGSAARVNISRKNGGRGLRSVKAEYKHKKIKAAVKLFGNSDTTMSTLRNSEEKAVQTNLEIIVGCRSIIQMLKSMPQSYTYCATRATVNTS